MVLRGIAAFFPEFACGITENIFIKAMSNNINFFILTFFSNI